MYPTTDSPIIKTLGMCRLVGELKANPPATVGERRKAYGERPYTRSEPAAGLVVIAFYCFVIRQPSTF